MFEVNIARHIARPVHEVFLFVGNFENDVHWWPAVLESRRLSAEEEVGARYWQMNKVLGVSYPITFEIEEYVLDQKVVFRSAKNALSFQATYLFVEEAAGTTINFIAKVEFNNTLFRMLFPVFKKAIERMTAKNFTTLKDILENQTPAQV